jgi:hypothetical protein
MRIDFADVLDTALEAYQRKQSKMNLISSWREKRSMMERNVREGGLGMPNKRENLLRENIVGT